MKRLTGIKLSKIVVFVAAIASFVGVNAAEMVKLGDYAVGFDLCLARPGSDTRHVCPKDMRTLSVGTEGGKTVATWSGNAICGENFSVIAEFTPQDGGWAWRFRYAGNENTTLDVEEVRFPVLVAPRTDKTAFIRPLSLGLLHRPDWAKVKPGQNVGGAVPHSFRFIAAFDEEAGTGVYFDERGARSYSGRFIIDNGSAPKTIRLIAEHWLPVTAASNRAYELPFGGLFRPYRGGWFEATVIYRDWMRTQDWAKAARRRGVSPKLRDIALWMWNRGAADHVISPAERFQDETGLKPALDWYWWHKIPYDHGYPHFWPPREGEEAFRAAIRRMKKRGIFSQVYTNGMTWDCDYETFENGGGLESVIITKRGKTYDRHLFNIYTGHALAYMCGEGKKHHDFFVGLTRQLADCGLDGLYMDQIGCGSLSRCWNPSHSHVPGGGTTQANGYREFFRQVRAANPDLLLATEEPNEEYIDVNDEAICLWQTPERFGSAGAPACEAVPIYPALHHGDIALFGTYAVMGGRPPWDETWPTKDKWQDESYWEKIYPKDQFALEVCAGPIMGIQPCVHNLTLEQIGDPKLAADWKFLKDTAAFYHANRDLLFDGEMLAPPKVKCDKVALDMAIRGIYTTEKKLKITHSVQNAVRASAWRAPDGKVGIVLVNWTSEPRQCELDVSSAWTGRSRQMLLPPRSWRRIDVPAEPVKIIFDTDMLTDFDDVGALASLHALADAGECEILATVSSTRGNASVAAVEVINGYYGRSDLPVGAPKGKCVLGASNKAKVKVDPKSPLGEKGGGDGGHYKYRKLAADYPQWVKHLDADDAPNAVEVYRRVLAAQPDHSVVVCSVGFLTNLANLLDSKPDANSPLDGRALVAKKVKKWVAMACAYPRGSEYNSANDWKASTVVLRDWPTPVVFTDFQYGFDTYAGRAIAEMDGPRNPVKDVFAGNIPSRGEVSMDPVRRMRGCYGMGGRSAWDETAVLIAVRGEKSYFNVHRGQFRMVGEKGENEWVPDEENGPHLRVTERVNKLEVGRIIDELICRKPVSPPPVRAPFD